MLGFNFKDTSPSTDHDHGLRCLALGRTPYSPRSESQTFLYEGPTDPSSWTFQGIDWDCKIGDIKSKKEIFVRCAGESHWHRDYWTCHRDAAEIRHKMSVLALPLVHYVRIKIGRYWTVETLTVMIMVEEIARGREFPIRPRAVRVEPGRILHFCQADSWPTPIMNALHVAPTLLDLLCWYVNLRVRGPLYLIFVPKLTCIVEVNLQLVVDVMALVLLIQDFRLSSYPMHVLSDLIIVPTVLPCI